MNDALKQRVYYSQNREDLILEAFFPDIDKGFYLDVGANDPLIDSVTKLFYEKGWHGINIEPIKRHYDALQAQRPRDINLNFGVGKKNDSLTFYEYTDGDGLSTFSSKIAAEYDQIDKAIYKNAQKYTVEIKTVREILADHKVEHIHFMKVDVEGFEYNVLAGNDWDRFRPEVICIESNHIVEDWRGFLKDHNYKMVFFDGLNEYYVDTKTDREAAFDFVNHVVIDKGSGLRQSDLAIIEQQASTIESNQLAIRDAHLKLQEALRSKAEQNELYQALLAENHNNHIRAVVAERALRHPLAFVKYQLKRLHYLALRILSSKSVPEYQKEEQNNMVQAIADLSRAQDDKQRLAVATRIADIEIGRLRRVYGGMKSQPASLELYLKFVGSVKRLRLKGRAK